MSRLLAAIPLELRRSRAVSPLPPSRRDRIRFSFFTFFFSCSSPIRVDFLVFVREGNVCTFAENFTRRLMLESVVLPPPSLRLDRELFLVTDGGWLMLLLPVCETNPTTGAPGTLAARRAEAEAGAADVPARRYERGGGIGAAGRVAVACAATSHRSIGEMCRWETRLVRLGDAGRPSKNIQYPLRPQCVAGIHSYPFQ